MEQFALNYGTKITSYLPSPKLAVALPRVPVGSLVEQMVEEANVGLTSLEKTMVQK